MRVDSRAERLAPWIAALAIALPIVLFRYPPGSDLPHHEGIVAILRHFGDPAFAPPGLYVLNLGHGNQLFHIAALALSYLLPTDVACKVVLGATVVANVVLGGRLAHHLNASRWAALLVAPAAVGWLFFMGFAHDLLGLALLQAALPSLDRYCERPTLRGALVVAGFTVALHLAHESGMVVFAGAMLVFAAGHPPAFRTTALRVGPFFLALALALGDIAWMKPLKSASVAAVPFVTIPLWRKLQTLPAILFGRYEEWLRLPLFALAIVTIVVLAIERWRSEADPVPRSPRAFIHRYRFELFAACAFCGYLVFPSTLNGATLVYQRFLAPAYVVAAISAAPRKDASMGAAPRVLVCIVPILTLVALWPVLQDSSTTHRALDRLFPLIAPGSSVVLVELDPIDASRVYLPSGASARVLAERGGRLMPSFTESPNAPVITTSAFRWDEPSIRLLQGAPGFFPAHDFRHFRNAIIHTKYDGNAAVAVVTLAPEARLVASAGEFLLFESKLDVAAVLSPDVPMEEPRPQSMFDRMSVVVAQWMAEGKLRDPTRGGAPAPQPPSRIRRDSVRVPLSSGSPREDFWQMHESEPLVLPDDQPRPVTLLFHGMCADSSWTCDWLQYFDMAPQWQLCPRAPGKCVDQDGYRWTGASETRRLVELSLAALMERHDGRVRQDAMVLAGFSLGAYAVASLVHELALRPSPSLSVRGILAQGAHVHFQAADLRVIGARVALTAGDLDAAAPAMRAEAEKLLREGIDARYVSLGSDESHFTSVSTGKIVAQLIDWCRGE